MNTGSPIADKQGCEWKSCSETMREDAHGHGTSRFFKYMQEAYKEPFSMARDLAVDAQQQHKAGCQPFGASAPLGSSADFVDVWACWAMAQA